MNRYKHTALHRASFAIFSLVLICGAARAGQISDAAYQLLHGRINENRENFFVYRDANTGLNHGFSSGFFGETAKLHLDLAAVNAPNPGPNTLDRTHGSVIKVTFDPLLTYAGINFEDPLNFGLNGGGRAYDLTGATSLVLDVCSPSGGAFAFGVGGKNTAFVTLPASTTFQTMTFDFTDMLDPETGQLSTPVINDIHVLFTVLSDGAHLANGGTILIDNVHFDPLPTSQQYALGLPVSYQTFGVVPLASADPGLAAFPPDQVLGSMAAAYDSALTMIALMKRTGPGDLPATTILANTLSYALHHENADVPLPLGNGGAVALHSAYSNGDISLFNSLPLPNLAQAGQARLANFQSSQFNLLLDGANSGSEAFAILALVTASGKLGDVTLLDDARTIGKWIGSNLADTTGTGYGGFYQGYTDGGAAKVRIENKSTENNAALYAAFTALAGYERDNGNPAAADDWTTKANIAGDFCMAMYDPSTEHFFTGTVKTGTVAAPGIILNPQGIKGNDQINLFDSLPANALAVIALAAEPRYTGQIDWSGPIAYMQDSFTVSVTAGGHTFAGYNTVTQPTAGPLGVSYEATAQFAVAARLVDKLYNQTTYEAAAAAAVAAIATGQDSAPFGDGKGLVGAVVQDGDTLPPLGQWLTNTPGQIIPERVGLAATAWAILADTNANPLLPKAKPIVTWAAPADIAYGTALSATQLNAAANVPGIFSYSPDAGAILNGGSQTLTATFVPSDLTAYSSVVITVTINVTKAGQTIAFTQADTTFDTQPLSLSAAATSQLLITYTVVSGQATVTGNSITFLHTGSVTVKASQAGDANFNAAPEVTVTFNVAKGNQTITFPPPGNKPSTSAPFALTATASSGLTVAYLVMSGPATVTGNMLTLTGTGMIVITASQAGDEDWNPAPDVSLSFVSAAPFTLKKFSGAFSFKAANKDSAQLTGSFTLPALPTFDGTHLDVNLGGAKGNFILDLKGKGSAGVKPTISTAALKSKLVKGTTNYLVSFTIKLKGSFVTAWGINRNAIINQNVPMVLDVTFGPNVFTVQANPFVKSKPGKGGTIK